MAAHPRHPRERSDGRGHRPCPQRAPPPQVRRAGQRHREPGRHSGGPADGHGVDAHHQAAAVGEVALDQRGQQDVADRDRAAGHDRAEEQQRRPVQHPDESCRRQRRHHPGQHGLDAEPARQPRSDGREQAEAHHRQGGQHGRTGARERQAGTQLGQHRPDPGDGGPQVDRDEDHGQRQQHRVPPRGRRRPPVGTEILLCHRSVIPMRPPSERAGTLNSPCRNAQLAVPRRATRGQERKTRVPERKTRGGQVTGAVRGRGARPAARYTSSTSSMLATASSASVSTGEPSRRCAASASSW